MKLIIRDTDYAVRALCFMAKSKKESVSVQDLVDELKIPGPFLRRILQTLNKKNFLKSSKGKGGGFRLLVDLACVSIADVMKVFQPSLRINECTFKKKICPHIRFCKLKRGIDKIEEEVIAKLKGLRLTSLI